MKTGQEDYKIEKQERTRESGIETQPWYSNPDRDVTWGRHTGPSFGDSDELTNKIQ